MLTTALSDAAHMMTDALALGISLVAIQVTELLHEQFDVSHATIQVEGDGFEHHEHDEVHA